MNWTKLQSIYERKAYRIIQRHVKEILNKIPTNNVTRSTYELLISGNITDLQVKNMFVEIYTTIGLNYGNKVKNSLEKDIKANILFNDVLLEQLLLFLSNEGGIKITSVRETLIESVIEAVKKQLGENATVIDIQNAIYNVVKRSQSFYKWQALRIARTETTTATNYATTLAAENSDFVLEKTWISVQDNRTRRPPKSVYDHLDMNGVKVDMYQPFFTSGENIQYPGDPTAAAGNVINCRCKVVFTIKEDENGLPIRKLKD